MMSFSCLEIPFLTLQHERNPSWGPGVAIRKGLAETSLADTTQPACLHPWAHPPPRLVPLLCHCTVCASEAPHVSGGPVTQTLHQTQQVWWSLPLQASIRCALPPGRPGRAMSPPGRTPGLCEAPHELVGPRSQPTKKFE